MQAWKGFNLSRLRRYQKCAKLIGIILSFYATFLSLSSLWIILTRPSSQLASTIPVTVAGASLKFNLNPMTKAYELDGRPIIWQYWHQDQVPLYVRLLVNAMQCRNPEFKVIVAHDSTLWQYIPDFFIPRNVYAILTPNHKADLFRIASLVRYGGVYSDVDNLVLDKMYPVYRLLDKYDIVTSNWGKEKLSAGFIGPARAALPSLKAWQDKQKLKITEKANTDLQINGTKKSGRYPFGWIELIGDTRIGLEDELKMNKTAYRAYDGYSTVGQLVLRGLAESGASAFDEVSSKFLPLKWSLIVFLHHATIKEQFWNIQKINDLIPRNATLFSAFVGCALLDCVASIGDEKIFKTLLTQNELKLNTTELLVALEKLDHDLCEKINKRKPIDFANDLLEHWQF